MRRMFVNQSCTNTTLIKIEDIFDLPVGELLPHDPRTAEEAKAKQIHFLKGQLDVYRKHHLHAATSIKRAVRQIYRLTAEGLRPFSGRP